MLRALVKFLKSSSSHEIKIINPELYNALVKEKFTKEVMIDIIERIENSKNINIALRVLREKHIISDSVIVNLQEELNRIKSINSILVLHDFLKHVDILEDLHLSKLPHDSNDLNQLIKENSILRNECKYIIKLLNRHKIKLSALSLSLETFGFYLYDAAKNYGGCYKYELLPPSNEYRLICKVKKCKHDLDLSINDKFCDELCESSCKGNDNGCSARVLTNNKIYLSIQYTCLKLEWYDVLSIIKKKFCNYISHHYKFFIIAVVAGFLVYLVYSNLNFLYILLLVFIVVIFVLPNQMKKE